MMNEAGDIQQKIKKHFQDITEIKRNFLKNQTDLNEKIKNMRLCHARAIIDLDIYTKYVCSRGPNATPNELVSLSICTSLMNVIHLNIKSCEKLAYGDGSLNIGTESPMAPITIKNEPDASSKVKITSHLTKNGTEELSLKGLATTEVRSDKSDLGSFKCTQFTSPMQSSDETTTDIINNMETSDIKKWLKTEAPSKQKGGADSLVEQFLVDKPTLINYWADWCPYSVSFKPAWEKFVSEEARTKFPHIQVLDFNVGADPKLDALAKRVGVRGYPTVAFFNNGKITLMVCGNKNANDICKFVEGHFNKK